MPETHPIVDDLLGGFSFGQFVGFFFNPLLRCLSISFFFLKGLNRSIPLSFNFQSPFSYVQPFLFRFHWFESSNSFIPSNFGLPKDFSRITTWSSIVFFSSRALLRKAIWLFFTLSGGLGVVFGGRLSRLEWPPSTKCTRKYDWVWNSRIYGKGNKNMIGLPSNSCQSVETSFDR